jgi:CheY-like chemotaxis protein
MVHGMVEQCGGRLEIASTPGVGTTVELLLPMSAPPAKREEQAEPAPEAVPPAVQRLTILAVDDDPIVLLNTATMLEDMGHRVYQASCGKVALKIFGENAIDLLLTDYAMPDMNGAELVGELRASHPGLPAIVASGYADLPEGVRLDASRLSKPFREDQLIEAIERARPHPADLALASNHAS